MKKIIIPFVLILTTALFVSCKDDDQTTEKTILPKAIAGTGDAINFSYNAQKQLTKIEQSDAETLFTYDAEGKLTKFVNIYANENGQETESFQVQYQSDTQVRIVDEDSEYTTLTLNDKGQLLSSNADGNITQFSYDAKGNVVRIEDGSETVTAAYNNHKGIFSGIKSPQWMLFLSDFDLQYFAVNNPTNVSIISTEGEETESYSEVYTYPAEHVISGYPTRMSVKYNDNGSTYSEVYNINY